MNHFRRSTARKRIVFFFLLLLFILHSVIINNLRNIRARARKKNLTEAGLFVFCNVRATIRISRAVPTAVDSHSFGYSHVFLNSDERRNARKVRPTRSEKCDNVLRTRFIFPFLHTRFYLVPGSRVRKPCNDIVGRAFRREKSNNNI